MSVESKKINVIVGRRRDAGKIILASKCITSVHVWSLDAQNLKDAFNLKRYVCI